jgi:hypothetical protein
MKPLAFALAIAGLLGAGAHAQVAVEVALDQDVYLPHEACMAEIRVTNFSGRPLRLSAKPDWFDLVVESNDGYIVEKLAEAPDAEAFEVPSSARGTRRVDLSKVFDIAKPGRYKVLATVHLPELNLDAASPKKSFNVGGGTKIWEQTFGVPAPAGQPVEVRRYVLIQTNAGKRLALYARVSDEHDDRVLRVFPLGGLLTFSRPEAQVDREGRLNVLFQTGAKMFTYYVIQPDGKVLARQSHQISDSRPALRLRDGEIKVAGGFRFKSDYDIPPPDSEAKPPQSPAPAAPQGVTPPPPAPAEPKKD